MNRRTELIALLVCVALVVVSFVGCLAFLYRRGALNSPEAWLCAILGFGVAFCTRLPR